MIANIGNRENGNVLSTWSSPGASEITRSNATNTATNAIAARGTRTGAGGPIRRVRVVQPHSRSQSMNTAASGNQLGLPYSMIRYSAATSVTKNTAASARTRG